MAATVALLKKREQDLNLELDRIVKLLIKRYRPERIILFGSLKNGHIDETSDIDLLIEKNTDKPFLQRIDEVISKVHPRLSLDIFVLTPGEIAREVKGNNPYIREIVDKGAIVYERKG